MKSGKYLIQIIALIAFSILTTLATLALANDTLVEPTTLQIRSLDAGIKFEDLEVSYSSLCRYRSGFIFPEAKNCGGSSMILPVKSDGTIQLPALTKQPGLHGAKTDNYEVFIGLQPKNRSPRDRTYYFTVATAGKVGIQELQNNREVIYFGNLKGTTLNVTAERRAILGSELAQVADANLFVFIRVEGPNPRNPKGLLISSPFSGGGVSFENRASRNGHAAKTELRDAQKIEVQGGAFAFMGNPADAKLVVQASYMVQKDSINKTLYKKDFTTKLDANALRDNNDIDLEKVR